MCHIRCIDFLFYRRHEAIDIDRLLKRAPPAGLPIKQEREFKLRISPEDGANMISVPSSLLARAVEWHVGSRRYLVLRVHFCEGPVCMALQTSRR